MTSHVQSRKIVIIALLVILVEAILSANTDCFPGRRGRGGVKGIPDLCQVSLDGARVARSANNSELENVSSKKVKLTVYFESLCPDSRKFFLEQLEPTYPLMEDNIEVILVPFGKARVLGQEKMICQHGAGECQGNRAMACLDKYAPSKNQSIASIACMFSFREPQDCVYLLGNVKYDVIEKCQKSEESFNMMIDNEKKTGKLNYVPHLTVDDQWSEDIQKSCEKDLKACICDRFSGGQKPQACM